MITKKSHTQDCVFALIICETMNMSQCFGFAVHCRCTCPGSIFLVEFCLLSISGTNPRRWGVLTSNWGHCLHMLFVAYLSRADQLVMWWRSLAKQNRLSCEAPSRWRSLCSVGQLTVAPALDDSQTAPYLPFTSSLSSLHPRSFFVCLFASSHFCSCVPLVSRLCSRFFLPDSSLHYPPV